MSGPKLDPERLASALTRLAHAIVFREPPFHLNEWPREVRNDFLVRFEKYKSEIDPSLRERYLRYVSVSLERRFKECMGMPSRESIADTFPDLYRASREVADFLNERAPQPLPIFVSCRGWPPQFKVNELIANTFKARSYRPTRTATIKGIKLFGRTLNGETMLVGFERGSLRSFMSLFVGLREPEFICDIGNFFFTGQSHFDYVYATETIGTVDGKDRRIITQQEPVPQNVVEITNKAIDIAEWLLPYVQGALRSHETKST